MANKFVHGGLQRIGTGTSIKARKISGRRRLQSFGKLGVVRSRRVDRLCAYHRWRRDCKHQQRGDEERFQSETIFGSYHIEDEVRWAGKAGVCVYRGVMGGGVVAVVCVCNCVWLKKKVQLTL